MYLDLFWYLSLLSLRHYNLWIKAKWVTENLLNWSLDYLFSIIIDFFINFICWNRPTLFKFNQDLSFIVLIESINYY